MESFFSIISPKFSIDPTQLNELWETYSNYNKMKKSELESLCIEKNVCSNGTKKNNIVSLMLDIKPDDTQIRSSTKTKESKASDIKKAVNSVAKHINRNAVEVKLNKHGNYEHDETKLLFDKLTKKVIGRQNHETGDIDTLNPEDIDICKLYGFEINCLPENLGLVSNTGPMGTSVENLEDIEEMIGDDSDSEIEIEI